MPHSVNSGLPPHSKIKSLLVDTAWKALGLEPDILQDMLTRGQEDMMGFIYMARQDVQIILKVSTLFLCWLSQNRTKGLAILELRTIQLVHKQNIRRLTLSQLRTGSVCSILTQKTCKGGPTPHPNYCKYSTRHTHPVS